MEKESAEQILQRMNDKDASQGMILAAFAHCLVLEVIVRLLLSSSVGKYGLVLSSEIGSLIQLRQDDYVYHHCALGSISASQSHCFAPVLSYTCHLYHPVPPHYATIPLALDGEALYKQGLRAYENNDHVGALNLWLEASKLGVAAAMCDVGWLYGRGLGTEKNEAKAFEYMSLSARLGFPRAQNNLGLYYKKGVGVPVDLAQAVRWFAEAEKANYPKLAQTSYEEAKRGLEQQQAAEKQRQQTLIQQQQQALLSQRGSIKVSGNNSSSGEDAESKQPLLPKQAQQQQQQHSPVSASINNNGSSSSSSVGSSVGSNPTVHHSHSPSNGGSVEVKLHLDTKGLREAIGCDGKMYLMPVYARSSRDNDEPMYYTGLDHFKSSRFKEAHDAWLSLSQEQCHAAALCDLGYLYSEGKGVVANPKKAFLFHLMSAALGYPRAMSNLGLFYKRATGCAKDLNKALLWLEGAAFLSYASLPKRTLEELRSLRTNKDPAIMARPNAADLAINGRLEYEAGLKLHHSHPQAALICWISAANSDLDSAMCDVGWLYGEGKATDDKPHRQQSFLWMERSAMLGYPRAQNNLGLYYRKGAGCVQSLDQAAFWLRKARDAKYPKLAAETLREIEASLEARDKAMSSIARGDSVKSASMSANDTIAFTAYKAALEIALSDPPLSVAVKQRLMNLRAKHNITEEIHIKALLEIGITPEQYKEATQTPPASPHTNAPAPQQAGVPPSDDSSGMCIVCLTDKADNIIIPCMHLCLCSDCKEEFVDGSACPMCRQIIKSVNKVYMNA